MKFEESLQTPSSQEMAEMLSRMKNLLIDVLLEKSLPDASKIKLKDCISMIETFSSFLSKKERQEKSQPPKSLADKLKTSKSASDISQGTLNGSQTTCPANISFNDDHSDYVISLQEAEKSERRQSDCSENPKILNLERKATKKRIKMLRWLKKAFVAKGQDDATIIGDIYKIESPDKHVKLWCMLRDRQLYGYHHVSDTTPVFKLPLDNCIAVPRTNVPGKKHAFDIEKEGVKLATFASQTAKEQARWIDIVKNRRGTIRIREIADDSGEEAEDSSEDEDNYVKVDDIPQTAAKFQASGEYVLPMSEDSKYDDAGYISVIALESEVDRRNSYRKQRKYNPNIPNKYGIEHLIEKDTPLLISTIPRESQGQCKNRSPAPLPRDLALLSGKPKTEVSKGLPAIQVDRGIEKEPGNGSDEGLENSMDLNNNTDAECLEEVNPDDEELSSDDEGIFHCQMTASSWLADSPPSQARFGPCTQNKIGAWRPETNDKTQFLEIDIGDFMTVGAIGVKGRPDFDEKGGEFIKSFTVHYSIDKETWIPYKSHGKVKVFQGITSASQECKKYFKSKTTAQYFRVYPQSWQNHIALQVALYKVDIGSSTLKKSGDKLTLASPTRRPLLKKKDISDPMHPSSDCLRTELTEPATFIDTGRKSPSNIEPQNCIENPASMESRAKLKEKLLIKEKREQITKLEVLAKLVDMAKDKMIVNSSGQLKREAIETEHDYLVANLELVKAKKRLIDIETEIRELRVFEEKNRSEKQDEQETHESHEAAPESHAAREEEEALQVQVGHVAAQEKPESREDREIQESNGNEVDLPKVKPRPAKPLKRRPSKEVMVCTDVVLPEVDPEGFNSEGEPPPVRKVLDNVKLFEKFQNHPR
ncbi:uncharacterized protein LOC114518215 isoform X2 [Dendronephthya gigantea]|uniref:uncharacterized protein LOC114518215 isoform X2 n=1 Tax=Dendronephthya gigantea TaxID=151771 RepID=UPI00106A7D50|nr:uncharacterized protein LOC114518215 isoform X2 [Dendronephthya gigantea]